MTDLPIRWLLVDDHPLVRDGLRAPVAPGGARLKKAVQSYRQKAGL